MPYDEEAKWLQATYFSWKAWACLSAGLPILGFQKFGDEMRLELNGFPRGPYLRDTLSISYVLLAPMQLVAETHGKRSRVLEQISMRDNQEIKMELGFYQTVHEQECAAAGVRPKDPSDLQQSAVRLIQRRVEAWSRTDGLRALVDSVAESFIRHDEIDGARLEHGMMTRADNAEFRIPALITLREVTQFFGLYNPGD